MRPLFFFRRIQASRGSRLPRTHISLQRSAAAKTNMHTSRVRDSRRQTSLATDKYDRALVAQLIRCAMKSGATETERVTKTGIEFDVSFGG
jgi:hypothetical protein